MCCEGRCADDGDYSERGADRGSQRNSQQEDERGNDDEPAADPEETGEYADKRGQRGKGA